MSDRTRDEGMRLGRAGTIGRWTPVRMIAAGAAIGLAIAGCGSSANPLIGRDQGAAAAAAPGGAARPTSGPDQPVAESTSPGAITLTTESPRRHDGVASGGKAAPYNYAPSVMRDGNAYRMWWCSQLPSAPPPGDDVLYSQASSPDGPFVASGRPAIPVLSGSGHGFDAEHTCDPSVIRVAGTYYLYYTGASGDRNSGNAIGVATSPDGVHWQRANNGKPIVGPSGEVHRKNAYGAGQPSVLFLDGWYYLMFTDTTGRAAGWNGAGQFVLRSTDPTFHNNVQSLSDKGFRSVANTSSSRSKSIVDAFSADWMWVDALQAFAVAHETNAGTTITFWDRNFLRNPYQSIVIGGPWQEGPGLVRTPDGHAPVSTTDPCGRVPFDVIRATSNAAAPTGLSHFGLDVRGIVGCATAAQAVAVLNGFAVPSPQRTIDLVVDGQLVRVDRASVAKQLATAVLGTAVPALAEVPVEAHLTPGAPAISAPGRPLGLLLDDGHIWPVGSAAVARANSSPVTTTTAAGWDAHPRGADLGALRGSGS